MKVASYRLEGLQPLLMQADTLADPLHPQAKALKEISSKRKKTDEDHEAMKRIEWDNHLYLGSDGKTIVIPSVNIHKMLNEAAKLQKRGKDVNRAIIFSTEDFPLGYEGPRDLRALYETPGFVDRRTVRVSTSKVVRTRPRFEGWWLEFSLNYDAGVINKEVLDSFVVDAGKYVGLGTYRPRFGRFEVTKTK